ncbi:lactose/cellobiose PTS transporter subunit IIB [Staphylococcus pettenkoferi]|uniref:lactose/cellobiose PTS transporter subunit IIB n=1 Tax=Staphylococcus pettenkoferi TaxID=170573 RepID=UPI001BCE71DB|nr:lactose/cellobiose PTS transporter subunit IIB [Staphylococcus pettenkoferi]
MNRLISQIEKAKPFFEKISRNIYLRAIRYTMGLVAILVAGTTAKSLTDSYNRKLKANQQLNFISIMLAAMCGFLLLSAEQAKEGGYLNAFMGTKGLLTAFLAAFITVAVYNFCMKKNITIKMPKEVPPNISQVFKDIIPFSIVILILYGLDLLIHSFIHTTVAEAILKLFEPLFTAADGWIGITIIFGAFAFFWFVGIHGPSIVEPAIAAITYANIETNFKLLHAGMHADKVITSGTQMFIVTLGGTGATLVVPFMFMWLTKSKRNKAIGRASVVPTFFGVNEPILFGAPLVLNPIFFIPFVFAPIANVWIFKFFVDVLGMNSFSVNLPWTTPGPLGIIMGTGFGVWSFVLAAVLIFVDVTIYYPFLKVYDKGIYLEEQENADNTSTKALEEKVKANFDTTKAEQIMSNQQQATEKLNEEHEAVAANTSSIQEETNVLVLCAGGGTSGLLANALNKAAEYHQPITAAAGSYGAHMDIMKDYQLVILAPQVASNYEDIKCDTDRLGIKLAKTQGVEYINLTRIGKEALEFVQKQFN